MTYTSITMWPCNEYRGNTNKVNINQDMDTSWFDNSFYFSYFHCNIRSHLLVFIHSGVKHASTFRYIWQQVNIT